MPFKSESQRRLFYAKQRRGEISKETLDEWRRTTGDKKLPERVKRSADESWAQLARVLREAGFEKNASIMTGLAQSVTKPFLPMLLAGGAGAMLGGEDARVQGAIAGLLGAWLGKSMLSGSVAKSMLPAEQASQTMRQLQQAAKADPALAGRLGIAQRVGNLSGGGLGAAGGGYAAKKVDEHNREKAMQQALSANYDIGGKYTGFLPDDYNIIPDSRLF
jgi:hypothetical protein